MNPRKLLPLPFVAFYFWAGSAVAAPPERFSVEPKESRLTFNIDSPILPFKGTIDRYSGSLTRQGAGLENIDVEFECDLSSVHISGQQPGGLPIDQIAGSLKGGDAKFVGRSIARTSKGDLKIKGQLTWRGKTYDVIFPVKVLERNGEILFSGSIASSGEELADQLPMLAMFQIEGAAANAQLTFAPASAGKR